MSSVSYFDTFPPFGSPGGPDDPWVIGVDADPLALGAHLGKDLLLIAEPLESGVEGTMDMDLFPPFGSLPDSWSTAVAERRTLYIAATTGRSTANDDEPPAQYVPGKLMPFNFGARLFEGLNPSARSANEGVAALIDPDGGLDGLIGRVWDGTPITIKRGARGTPFSTWPVVGRFRSAGLVRDLDTKQIQLRTLGWLLEGSLHDETYAGTGGVAGTGVNIVGRKKPWALGYCFNIEPVLLSASDQIFQWSKTSSQELEELRHGGVIFPVNADYPTYAALAAATIPPGECATCLANSLVRPNVDLAFGIRVDVIGDADVVNGHPAPLTRAAIARRIVTSGGQNRIDDDSEIDNGAFNLMETYHSSPVGWYFDGDFTKAAALDRVLAGVLGYWRVRPDGRLTIGWLERPESMVATVTITGGKDDVGKPRLMATANPRRGTRISWRWNYAPQPDRSSLAGAVSGEDAAIYARPASYGQSLDAGIASTWPTAALVTVDFAGYRDEAPAVAEAARQQTVFSVVRRRWARDLQIDPFIDLLGSPVMVADDPLQAGGASTQLCVAIEATGSSVQTFEFFT